MKKYKDIPGDGGSNILAQVEEQSNRLQTRMASIRNIITVMSGKGGVGKSSVTVNLAFAFALKDHSVGILDADINGPSIAKMTGVRNYKLQYDNSGIKPASSKLDMKIMSMDLFLPEDSTPVLWDAPTQKVSYTWRGMMEAAAVREFLSDTNWGELNTLFIDLPPGTDKLPNLADLLPKITGTIIVTIPSAVSQLVVGKSIKMANEILNTPIIGIIENMSNHVCSNCGFEEELFPAGNVGKFAKEHGVPYLGFIPFDPRLAVSADEGDFYLTKYSDRPAGKAIKQMASKILDSLNELSAVNQLNTEKIK